MTATRRRDDIERHIQGPSPLQLVEAEKALLGILLGDPGAMDVIDGLAASHMAEPLHGRLFEAMRAQHGKSGVIDIMLLDGQFSDDESYRAAGGLGWLSDLIELREASSRAEHYVAAIREAAGRRALLQMARAVAEKAADAEGGALPELLAEIERGAAEIGQASEIADAWLKPSEMISGAVARAQERKGALEFPVGIPEVDRLLGGLHRGEVTLMAARPGMGKSIAAMAYAKAAARTNRLCLFFALEMSADAMAIRMACDLAFDRDRPSYLGATSNITMERIDRNELDDDEWRRLDVAQREAARWPLRFDTRAGHTMQRIEALSRRAFARAQRVGVEPGLIIIDHIGKVKPAKDRRGNMHAEMADRSAEASEMAKRLDVPVLALVQLNRGVEGRDDKRPMLSDLRQAGELEEDARQVIFLYRPEYYLRAPAEAESFDAKVERESKLDAARNRLFWIVEKNSHGPRGQALTFCEVAASAVREWRS